MHPVMQRRRHRLMTRRVLRRRSPVRTVAITLVSLFTLGVLFVGAVTAGTAAGGLFAYRYFATGLPDPRILDGINPPASTYVYDRTGTVLLARFECENREQARFAELPDSVINATVAAEDRTFWTNDGIDYAAVARAALVNLQAGGIVQGASTITQQVIKYAGSIKEALAVHETASAPPSLDVGPVEPEGTDPCQAPNLTFLQGRGFADKIREQILARQVTAAYPGRAGKERILETYLNLIFYGNGSYGIKAAAANFFGQSDPGQLTVAQAAFLAGLPQAPSYYDPFQPSGAPRGPERALARRDDVLAAMLKEHYLTQREYNEAVATTWEEMHPSKIVYQVLEPHFAYRVQGEAERVLAALGVANPAEAIRTGGYRIITTLDYPLQQVAKQQVAARVKALKKKNVNNAALVAIDSSTGQIIAYVGSVDYNSRTDPRVQGQFDVAGLGMRQPGSAFKPIVYTSAFRARAATVATFLVDNTTVFGVGTAHPYIPLNASYTANGPMMAMDALRYSLNVPSVMMQQLVGIDISAEFAESLGIATKDYILGQDPGLSLTLGAVPVNLSKMVQAYSAFAGEGTLHPATTLLEIRDRTGKVVYDLAHNGPAPSQPMTPAEAYLTHWILQGNTDPKLNLIWGSPGQLKDPNGVRREATVKTGTSNEYRDTSAYGYVPGGLTVGVWIGNNNQEETNHVTSVVGPLPLWHSFMVAALNKPWDWNDHQPVPITHFKQPPGIQTASICRFSGMAATSACGPTIKMPFLEGTVPPPDNVHVRKSGGDPSQQPGGGNGNQSPGSSGGFVDGVCFDIAAEVAQDPRRPAEWARAAQQFADRVVNGEFAAKGSIKLMGDLGPERVWVRIRPLQGRSGYGDPLCGVAKFTPTPSPTGSGPGGSSCTGNPLKCTPTPTPVLVPGLPAAPIPNPGLLVPIFGVPLVSGLTAMAARGAQRLRRRGRRG